MGEPAKCAGRSAVQQYFIDKKVRNFCSVSISG